MSVGSGGDRLSGGDTTEYSQQAGGMHPTGMLSGFLYFYSNSKPVHQVNSSELLTLIEAGFSNNAQDPSMKDQIVK